MFDGCCPPRFTFFLQPACFRCWLHAQLAACHRGSFPVLINTLDIYFFPFHSFFCFLSRYFISFSCLLGLLESLILLPQVSVASSIASRLARFTTHVSSRLFKKALERTCFQSFAEFYNSYHCIVPIGHHCILERLSSPVGKD